MAVRPGEKCLEEPITAKELQKIVLDTGLVVNRTTTQRTLNNKDLHGRVTRKKPFLRPQYKKKCVKRKQKPFGTICFGLTKPKWKCWSQKQHSIYREENLANCLAWRWIHCALGLCGSWRHRKHCAGGRRMDSNNYKYILEADVRRSVQKLKLKRDLVFQQDNHPKYTSKSTMKYLQERWITVLEWPPHSPDLNIIKESVESSQPCHAYKKEYF